MLGGKGASHLPTISVGRGGMYLETFQTKHGKTFIFSPFSNRICKIFTMLFANFLLVNILKEKLCWEDLTRLIQKVPSGKLLSWLPKSFELPSSKTFDWYLPSARCLHWKRTRVLVMNNFQFEKRPKHVFFAAVFHCFLKFSQIQAERSGKNWIGRWLII